MPTLESLEERLSTVERELAQLRGLVKRPIPKNWLDAFDGAFADCPEFEEVVRYGREFRHADRPADLDQRDQ